MGLRESSELTATEGRLSDSEGHPESVPLLPYAGLGLGNKVCFQELPE